jgi:type IV fimbrial biogenesis protein FimT
MKELLLKGSLLKVRKNSMYEQGFTLIELMVTLVILAIFISLAAPSFVTMINNNRATGATNDLVASFQLARTEAIKRHGIVLIRSKNGSDWSDGYRVQVAGTLQTLRDVDALHSTVSLDETSFPTSLTRIDYLANGGVEAAAKFVIDTSNCESGVSRKVRNVQLRKSGSHTLTYTTEVCP